MVRAETVRTERVSEPKRMFYVLYLFLKLRIVDTEDIDEHREGCKNSGSAQGLALNGGEKKARDVHRKAVICCDRGPRAAKEALLSLRYATRWVRGRTLDLPAMSASFRLDSSRIKELSKRSSERKHHSRHALDRRAQ